MTSSIDLRQLAANTAAEVEVTRTPVVARNIKFTLTYDAPDGSVYTDEIESVVMDSDGRMTKTRVYTGLVRGMINIPDDEMMRIDALARMMAQIPTPPDWLLDWAGADIELLSEVNAILVRHENAYFRGNNRKGTDDEIQARIHIDCPLLKATGSTVP